MQNLDLNFPRTKTRVEYYRFPNGSMGAVMLDITKEEPSIPGKFYRVIIAGPEERDFTWIHEANGLKKIKPLPKEIEYHLEFMNTNHYELLEE